MSQSCAGFNLAQRTTKPLNFTELSPFFSFVILSYKSPNTVSSRKEDTPVFSVTVSTTVEGFGGSRYSNPVTDLSSWLLMVSCPQPGHATREQGPGTQGPGGVGWDHRIPASSWDLHEDLEGDVCLHFGYSFLSPTMGKWATGCSILLSYNWMDVHGAQWSSRSSQALVKQDRKQPWCEPWGSMTISTLPRERRGCLPLLNERTRESQENPGVGSARKRDEMFQGLQLGKWQPAGQAKVCPSTSRSQIL